MDQDCIPSSSLSRGSTTTTSDGSNDCSYDTRNPNRPDSPQFSELLIPPFEDNTSETDVYAFETDHVALTGNKEYRDALNVLLMYEAQRIQAIKDMNSLIEIQDEALKDPIAFVDKLQNGVDLKIPKPIHIAPPLKIQWEKYTSVAEHLIGSRRQSMRIGSKVDASASGNFALSQIIIELDWQAFHIILQLMKNLIDQSVS